MKLTVQPVFELRRLQYTSFITRRDAPLSQNATLYFSLLRTVLRAAFTTDYRARREHSSWFACFQINERESRGRRGEQSNM